MIIAGLIICIISLVVVSGFAVSYKKNHDHMKKCVDSWLSEKGTGKEGIMEINYNSSVVGYVEVEELNTADGKIKIKVLTIQPKHDVSVNYLKGLYEELGTMKVGSCLWISSFQHRQISWYDNWEQKKRNQKLEELLGDA